MESTTTNGTRGKSNITHILPMIHTASFTKSYSLRGFALKEGSNANVPTNARSNLVKVHGNLAHEEVKKHEY